MSVKKALDYLGVANVVTKEQSEIERSDAIILPGVGAFPAAAEKLKAQGLDTLLIGQALKDRKPFLGICLGMQLLFDYGLEFQKTEGLALIPGSVVKIDAPGLKIPHMGWNDMKIDQECALTEGLVDGCYAYFVHSYRAQTEDRFLSMSTQYGERIPAMVFRDNIFGTQFHPEKSGEVGLTILKNFGRLAAC